MLPSIASAAAVGGKARHATLPDPSVPATASEPDARLGFLLLLASLANNRFLGSVATSVLLELRSADESAFASVTRKTTAAFRQQTFAAVRAGNGEDAAELMSQAIHIDLASV